MTTCLPRVLPLKRHFYIELFYRTLLDTFNVLISTLMKVKFKEFPQQFEMIGSFRYSYYLYDLLFKLVRCESPL